MVPVSLIIQQVLKKKLLLNQLSLDLFTQDVTGWVNRSFVKNLIKNNRIL